jgi:PAS domain S-box-containing protein
LAGSKTQIIKMQQPIAVRQWLWLAFSRHALIPLLVVESVLILVYVLSVQTVNDRNTDYLRKTAIGELEFSANRYAAYIESRLSGVTNGLEIYVDAVTRAFDDGNYQPPADELARRQYSAENIYHTAYDNGGAATFYPPPKDGRPHDTERANKLIAVDGLMKSLVERNSLITQVYFNDANSFNHIYPYFDVVSQYPHDVDVTLFSFFFLGDPEHNPERKVGWTEVYVDPAGQGWMTTAVKPVYVNDEFAGVAGFDLAIKALIAEVEEIELPWNGYAMLVDEYLNIVALSPNAAAELGLEALPTDVSEGKVYELTRQDERYNLHSKAELELLSSALATNNGSLSSEHRGQNLMFGWQTVPGPNWKLITIVNEQALFAQTNALNRELNQVVYWMIAGLVVFYLTFFFFIWRRTQRFSAVLEGAIEGSKRRLKRIEQRDYVVAEEPPSPLIEFNDLADSLDTMASVLNNYVERISVGEKRLRQALQTSGDIVIEIDSAQRIVYGSSRLMQLLGYDSEHDSEALHTLMDLVHNEDRALMAKYLEQAVKEGSSYDYELRILCADGQYIWVQARGTGVLDEASGARKVVAIVTNIDQRKRAALHLQQAQQAAEQANRAKTLFLSSVTHELRTPLSAIIGFTQVAELGELADFQQTALTQIKQASAHLRNLVDDILTQSEIEANALALDLNPTDIDVSITDAINVVKSSAAEHQVELHYVRHNNPLVLVDTRRLHQILINLLSNGIKYNRQRGHVYITSEYDDDYVYINVRDEGKGIDMENLERIFDPFVRIGKEASAIQGTGIGLTISRDLAQRMGGRIRVSSTLDHGSIFTLSLLRAEDPSV